jgi:hypothetical protein
MSMARGEVFDVGFAPERVIEVVAELVEEGGSGL